MSYLTGVFLRKAKNPKVYKIFSDEFVVQNSVLTPVKKWIIFESSPRQVEVGEEERVMISLWNCDQYFISQI